MKALPCHIASRPRKMQNGFCAYLVGCNAGFQQRLLICANMFPKMKWFYRAQYIPRNMHTVFALLCFVVVIHWLIFPYPSGLLHWHCGNLTIAPVPAKQPWWIWINTLCEFIMNDCITATKQSTTNPCAYFLGYTVGFNCRVQNWRTGGQRQTIIHPV